MTATGCANALLVFIAFRIFVCGQDPETPSPALGYVLQDPETFDEKLRAEAEFDRQRSVSQCFCGDSRHAHVWQQFHNELHAGLEADPGFRGEWVHTLCGVAYPVIARAISVDPSDDTFTLHTDCSAGILAMLSVCVQSEALVNLHEPDGIEYELRQGGEGEADGEFVQADDSGPWQSADGNAQFWRTLRVVRDEGDGVNDLFGPVLLEQCMAQCEQQPGCLSFAHGPNGCHLKARCVHIGDELLPENDQTKGYYTYYRRDCGKSGETDFSASAAESTPPAEESTHMQELRNLMTSAIRVLEFCFHCLDASPWPFLVSEVTENYALWTEAPQDFSWQRAAGRVAGASGQLGLSGSEAELPSLDPPSDGPTLRALPPLRLALSKLQVRWTRGLESEASFWRRKLSLDPQENDNTERLQHWLETGEVVWFLDDPCTFLVDALKRDAGGKKVRSVPRMLNAGSGPFAPGPITCRLSPDILPAPHSPASVAAGGRSGPLSWRVPVVAADGLARYYARIMDEHGLMAPQVPQQCPAEELHACFPPSHFDVVHVRNALDHSFDPLLGIERMLRVVRPGGWVLLRHARNEGVPGQFRNGLHQWSFDVATEDPGLDKTLRDYIASSSVDNAPSQSAVSFVIWNPELRVDVTRYLLDSGLAAAVRTELHDHPSEDAPPDEKFVWVDIRRPTSEEASAIRARLAAAATEKALGAGARSV